MNEKLGPPAEPIPIEQLQEFLDWLDAPDLTQGQVRWLYWLNRPGHVVATRRWGGVQISDLMGDSIEETQDFVRALAAGEEAHLQPEAGPTAEGGMPHPWLSFFLSPEGMLVISDEVSDVPGPATLAHHKARQKADRMVGRLFDKLPWPKIPLPTWNGGRLPFE